MNPSLHISIGQGFSAFWLHLIREKIYKRQTILKIPLGSRKVMNTKYDIYDYSLTCMGENYDANSKLLYLARVLASLARAMWVWCEHL